MWYMYKYINLFTYIHECNVRMVPKHEQCTIRVQENFSKTSRIQIFDLYPVVGHLFVRCFLMFFGGRFGRVSRGTLPILATIHAVLVELQRVLLLYKTFLLFFD